ncbi:MAG: hypothetical protein ACYS6K_03410 [Planctomycetota bacterium]|jgi:hypothetical protein
MSFNVYYDSERNCVFVSIEGDFDMEQAKELAQEAVKQATAHNCKRLLNDLRKANVKLSTIEIYDLPAYISDAGLDRLCKRALIVSQDFDDYKFFENVSSNQGHLVEVFADSDEFSIFRNVDEAQDWLGLDNPNQ